MFELSIQLYTLYRLYLDDSRVTPMLVDATWVVRVVLVVLVLATLAARSSLCCRCDAQLRVSKHRLR